MYKKRAPATYAAGAFYMLFMKQCLFVLFSGDEDYDTVPVI